VDGKWTITKSNMYASKLEIFCRNTHFRGMSRERCIRSLCAKCEGKIVKWEKREKKDPHGNAGSRRIRGGGGGVTISSSEGKRGLSVSMPEKLEKIGKEIYIRTCPAAPRRVIARRGTNETKNRRIRKKDLG